ncbi:MAG: aminotransferase class I/II-fold pyridoxal phosphate-dependent enzyme [Candidatus Buchananbacteria bacterium]|nr:aminotransferase class I/II-fold pyridoxal phosphate-dependent enzyme [Candidatus Buchananbacteria bacterium]
MKNLTKIDPEIYQEIIKETNRQKNGLIMIASENFTSEAVLETMATVLSNKYAEGYPDKRYYTGNQFIDNIETYCIERAKKLFQAEHVNVQPHSGTSANLAAYFALLKPGDKILSMDLSHGGHLSHGSKASLVSQLYQISHYGVDPKTETIDYDQLTKIALAEKPQLIISGASSYPRQIDFAKINQIAQKIKAYHLADIAHIAGLCVANLHHSAINNADVITTTTHKTLRGPRSAVIIAKSELAQKIDKAVFPGIQGGPLEHIIAAKAVCFKQAMSAKFKKDQQQTIKNATTLAQTLLANNIRLVSGGTDTHLILIDLRPLKITGKQAADILAKANIYTNFNVIPFDDQPANNPSGLRLGAAALTTQGLKETEMQLIGQTIADILKNPNTENLQNKAKELVEELTNKFPIYQELSC